MKKALAKASAFFSDINPFGICDICFASEIMLRIVKCAAAREGIYSISLDPWDQISLRPQPQFHIYSSNGYTPVYPFFFIE